MYFCIYISIFFCNVYSNNGETLAEKTVITVTDIVDVFITLLNSDDKKESERIKDLKYKLSQIDNYVLNKDKYAELVLNFTKQNDLNQTNFYNALLEQDYFQSMNHSKNLYSTLKEKMNRDDIFEILSKRGGKKLKKTARRMLSDTTEPKQQKEKYLEVVVDEYLAQAGADNHKFDESLNSEFWDPKYELEERQKHSQLNARRLFKGERTLIEYYPFIVSVHVLSQFWCAGSLFWRDLVITAAACLQLVHNNRFYRENPKAIEVRVGSNNSLVGGEIIEVLEVYFHPSYNPKTLANNIALIRLRRHIGTNYHRVPKFLPISHSDQGVPHTAEVLLLGWGVSEVAGRLRQEPIFLHKKILPVYPPLQCKEIYGEKFNPRHMFCAGTVSTGEGACSHDAGGPALLNGKMVGIISYGPAICGFPDSPTVLTLVGSYIDWIASVNETMPGYYMKKSHTTTPRNHIHTFEHDDPENIYERFREEDKQYKILPKNQNGQGLGRPSLRFKILQQYNKVTETDDIDIEKIKNERDFSKETGIKYVTSTKGEYENRAENQVFGENQLFKNDPKMLISDSLDTHEISGYDIQKENDNLLKLMAKDEVEMQQRTSDDVQKTEDGDNQSTIESDKTKLINNEAKQSSYDQFHENQFLSLMQGGKLFNLPKDTPAKNDLTENKSNESITDNLYLHQTTNDDTEMTKYVLLMKTKQFNKQVKQNNKNQFRSLRDRHLFQLPNHASAADELTKNKSNGSIIDNPHLQKTTDDIQITKYIVKDETEIYDEDIQATTESDKTKRINIYSAAKEESKDQFLSLLRDGHLFQPPIHASTENDLSKIKSNESIIDDLYLKQSTNDAIQMEKYIIKNEAEIVNDEVKVIRESEKTNLNIGSEAKQSNNDEFLSSMQYRNLFQLPKHASTEDKKEEKDVFDEHDEIEDKESAAFIQNNPNIQQTKADNVEMAYDEIKDEIVTVRQIRTENDDYQARLPSNNIFLSPSSETENLFQPPKDASDESEVNRKKKVFFLENHDAQSQIKISIL